MIADQLGHARVSMTQDVYLGRRAGNAGSNVSALEASKPDSDPSQGRDDSSPDSSPEGPGAPGRLETGSD